MNRACGVSTRSKRLAVYVLALMCSLLLSAVAQAQFTLVKISNDNLTNSDSVHKTEVEPDTFAWGSTIVSAFHVGRRPGNVGWGSADVGFATSTDGGLTWHHGNLPGLTVNYKGGTYYGAADPSVAYDAKHGQWLISTLPLINPIGDVAVSRSKDGIHWGKPILVDKTHLDDKNWTVCDNTASSPFYGHCYTEWDAAFGSGDVLMSTSTDGGKTWSPGKPSADQAGGLGGQPLVQPNGTVVVPFEGFGIAAFRSTDGGKTWGRSVSIANISEHQVAGGMRNPNLPSAEIDGAGKIYVVWSDCRFRTGCSSNDIVMSTSTDGQTWSSPSRIPIDPRTSTVDHFIPGIGVDQKTSGNTASLTLVYYYYPVANCGSSCQLDVGFTTSQDGGQTWTKGTQLAGPMKLSWLPNSDLGPMVADYISVSYTDSGPFGVFAAAKAPQNGLLREAMYTTKEPLVPLAGEPRVSSEGEMPVPNAKSDYRRKAYYDDEGRFPIPQSRRNLSEPKK
jgi:hypothetical protein